MDAIKKFVENNKTFTVIVGSLAAFGSIAVYIFTTKSIVPISQQLKAIAKLLSIHP